MNCKIIGLNNKKSVIYKFFFTTFILMVIADFSSRIGDIVDSIVIANYLGANAIAAFGLANPLIAVFCLFGTMLAAGTTIMSAKLVGANKIEEAQVLFSTAFFVMLLCSVVFAGICIAFAEPLAKLLGAADNMAGLLSDTTGYLIGISIGIPATSGVRFLTAYMYLDNAKQRAVTAVSVLTLVNVSGDILAVLLNGNLFYIGLTTALGNYAGFVVLALHFKNSQAVFRPSLKKLNLRGLKTAIAYGAPIGIGRVMNTLRSIMLNWLLVISATTNASLVAYTVQRSTDNILHTLVFSLGSTAAMLAAVFIGEKNKEGIKETLEAAIHYTVCIVALGSALVFLAAPLIARLYAGNEPVLIEASADAIRFYALCLPAYALNITYQSYLQSSNRKQTANILAFLGEGSVTIILALVLNQLFGEIGILLAFPLTSYVVFLVVICMVICKHKEYKTVWDCIISLPEGFAAKPEQCINRIIHTAAEVDTLSREAWEFCQRQGIDKRKTYIISLAIEELAGNIIKHGFKDGKDYSIDLRLVIQSEDKIILRIRDNCQLFNPKEWWEKNVNNLEADAAIGIRLILSMAENVEYRSFLGMNNLLIKL